MDEVFNQTMPGPPPGVGVVAVAVFVTGADGAGLGAAAGAGAAAGFVFEAGVDFAGDVFAVVVLAAPHQVLRPL